MALLGELLEDYLAYPNPISFVTDESFTCFWFYAVWISCWHILGDFNTDLAVLEERSQDVDIVATMTMAELKDLSGHSLP